MEEKRISIYGKDSEDHDRRAFDLVRINGETFLETVTRNGRRVKTPAEEAAIAIEKMALSPA